MGETFAEVKLIANNRVVKKKLLVDTGSTYSWIKSSILKRLGVKPIREGKFEAIEGKFISREIGEIKIECMDNVAHTIVVFATNKDSEVLGLHALEGLALEVDPVSGKLKKVKAIKAL